MSFFERLKTVASAEWRAYTEHPFTNGLADGSLGEAAFRWAILFRCDAMMQ
jgi:thiaminase/transcriptional activator TenA